MSKSHHPGDIKVRGNDRMCFWVDPTTLDPRGCEIYDAYAFSDPEPVPTMSYAEWSLNRAALRSHPPKATFFTFIK